jgi:hypothetical protein
VEQKNFKEQVWTGVGIIVGSMIVFGVALYLTANDLQEQIGAVTKSRSDIADQSVLINSYSNLKENAQAAAAYQTAMDQLLATQDNLIAFPSQINGLARNNGVDLVFSFEGDPVPAGSSTVGYVDFKLNATGSLDGITAFLKDMESSTPVLLSTIDSFDLTQSGSNYIVVALGRVFFK